MICYILFASRIIYIDILKKTQNARFFKNTHRISVDIRVHNSIRFIYIHIWEPQNATFLKT